MGTILIEGKTILPDTLFFESQRISSGWIVAINLDRYKLERRIRDTGGAIVSVRGDFKAAVCGFDIDKTVRKALLQVLLRTKSANYNCLEVTTVGATRVLGLVHASVSARAWRIVATNIASASALSTA